jgi:long-chain acyl-CoA synthetase
VKYILNDCQVKTLITDKKHYDELNDVRSNCPQLTCCLITDDKMNHPIASSFSDTLKNYPSSCPKNQCIDIDLASLIYTSGTTGKPKGVMLTHLNILTAANSIIEYLENRSDDIILDCLPLSFDYGLYQIFMSFKFGGTVVLEQSFLYPYQIIEVLIREQVTGFPLVPTIAAILLQMKHLDTYDFSHLRYISSTAETLAPKHIVHLLKIFPSTKIYSMYGLTECKRVSYLHPDELLKRPTSVGKAIPNTEVYLINEAGERITQPNQIGQLVVRGAHIMKGYWNLPEETNAVLKPGQYLGEQVLYTGDLFKMDSEGYLYFMSRKDDIIKTGGEKVSPKEIENVLYELDDVLEAGVIGVPDDILGHAIKAIVAVKKNSLLTEKMIRHHCASNLDSCMVPKYIEIHQNLPKTLTGKTQKKRIAQ